MSKLIKSIIIILFAVPAIWASSAFAADRVYSSNGSVWNVSFVKTKPGKYDDYLADLNNVWRKSIEAQMKDGDILSYKIMNVAAPRRDESNLILMVEFKNWAAFDKSDEYFDALTKKLQGSVAASTQANIDRGELRTLNGSTNLQEVKFKN